MDRNKAYKIPQEDYVKCGIASEAAKAVVDALEQYHTWKQRVELTED